MIIITIITLFIIISLSDAPERDVTFLIFVTPIIATYLISYIFKNKDWLTISLVIKYTYKGIKHKLCPNGYK